jgi:hypothetical protein
MKWLREVFSEPDTDDKQGKISFSRVFGGAQLVLIFYTGFKGKVVPDAWMTVFWVLIGYQFASKALGPDGVRALINWKTGNSAATTAPATPPPPDVKPG